MPNHNHHHHHLQQQVPTVNLKPVTSLHQVLYQNQQQQQQQSQGNNCSYQGNNSKVNGHHLEFDMIKVKIQKKKPILPIWQPNNIRDINVRTLRTMTDQQNSFLMYDNAISFFCSMCIIS